MELLATTRNHLDRIRARTPAALTKARPSVACRDADDLRDKLCLTAHSKKPCSNGCLSKRQTTTSVPRPALCVRAVTQQRIALKPTICRSSVSVVALFAWNSETVVACPPCIAPSSRAQDAPGDSDGEYPLPFVGAVYLFQMLATLHADIRIPLSPSSAD